MYAERAVDEAALRRLETLLTHKLDQLDAKWDGRFHELKFSLDALKSSLDWKVRSIESRVELWSLLPWLAAVMMLIVILFRVVGPR